MFASQNLFNQIRLRRVVEKDLLERQIDRKVGPQRLDKGRLPRLPGAEQQNAPCSSEELLSKQAVVHDV
jgi:hypothetical protein